MQTVYTATHGLQAQQYRLDTIASNIANVSTAGYKSQNVCFKDALYTKMIDSSEPQSPANLQQGSGILVSSSYRDFAMGAPEETSETFDLYIEGDGFFAVQDSNQERLFTRNGAFKVSDEADGKYLVTVDGYYVLDESGSRISLPNDNSGVAISDEGMLDFGDGTTAKLQVVTFTNKDGLLLLGNGCYADTEASGDIKLSNASIKQGYLESSNVDISIEFSKLIRTQRAYSLAGRVLSTWDEMESETNSIR